MSSRVLIVDDSEDDIEMIRRFLASDEIEIRGLQDSAQAEKVFIEFEPDLVLLDLHMPQPDGLEILRRLRDARRREGFLPVVVLTGDVGPVARNNALDLGADDYLTKPLDRQEVVLRVRNLLSTRRLHVELARAYRHKSDFLASMSHELRTQLSSIIGFSELLIYDSTDRFDEENKQKFLGQINSSGRYLLALINDILDLSKVEAGQIVLRIENVLVEDMVRNVMGTMEPIAAKKAIRLEADGASAGQVPADLGKLKQMLLNLMSNAVKFTPEGGCVTVGARRLVDVVEISVADTGVGIAESDREHLFEEFRQLDSTIAHQQPGTGLGLALTKRFVELHGGHIRFVSEPGKGSVFTLTLPLVPAVVEVPAPAPELIAEDAVSDTRPLVLIVEDNLQSAHVLSRQLDRGGFRSEVAVNGPEAVAKAGWLQPIAITLDILLPGVNGWDVLTQLKRGVGTRDIPVVVISAIDKPELGRALGAIDYFVKPVDGKALLKRLSEHISPTRAATEPTRILIIDDEPANRAWLEEVLKPEGFEAIVAAGGREGIQLAKSRDPHLILLDLQMPEVTGFDVVEALRADNATRSIPIMILTAKDLTLEDEKLLDGRVAGIRSRGATGGPDLLGWLRQVLAAAPAAR